MKYMYAPPPKKQTLNIIIRDIWKNKQFHITVGGGGLHNHTT